MNAVHTNTQYSILGTSVRLDDVDGDVLVFHAPLRLGPGRIVSLRTDGKTLQATVLSAHVRSLDSEHGPTYELRVKMKGENGDVRTIEPRPAFPAIDADILKKGEKAA